MLKAKPAQELFYGTACGIRMCLMDACLDFMRETRFQQWNLVDLYQALVYDMT
jgi:hypothetical protein